jgi:hypothetical protein
MSSIFHVLCVLVLLAPVSGGSAERIAQLNTDNPFAQFSVNALEPSNVGGCYKPSAAPPQNVVDPFTFTDEELRIAREGPVDVDWRVQGAVGPVQQQHPFGTCWAFSMMAVTEAINVIQGKNPFQKLSEQMLISCVPQDATGDNSDVLWSWAQHSNDGKYQTEDAYPYNRTCNNYREQTMAPDGTPDGFPGTCPPGGVAGYPCPPCPGIKRKDGTPPCHFNGKSQSQGVSLAKVEGWSFIAPHGIFSESPHDVTRMVAALQKYGPAQIGIDASCVEGYTGGIITNCTRQVSQQVGVLHGAITC